jgi:putative Mg2+ transporter-C (MgtC) family protein
MLEAIGTELSVGGGPALPVLIVRILGAVLFCGVIGFEREVQETTAGLRTNILVGVAAAGFALTTLILLDTPIAATETIRTDPVRLVEAVTNGVAFLAAGIVVFSKGEVRGLTTGASLWISASIGLAAGLGFWALAIIVTATGFFVLAVLRQFEIAVGTKDD